MATLDLPRLAPAIRPYRREWLRDDMVTGRGRAGRIFIASVPRKLPQATPAAMVLVAAAAR